MQPVELRMALVDDFLRSVKPSLTYDISALQDGFGPAIVDPRLRAIVVSEETHKGGQMCNDKRGEKGMSLLDVVTMPLVPISCFLMSRRRQRAEHMQRATAEKIEPKSPMPMESGTVTEVTSELEYVEFEPATPPQHATASSHWHLEPPQSQSQSQ